NGPSATRDDLSSGFLGPRRAIGRARPALMKGHGRSLRGKSPTDRRTRSPARARDQDDLVAQPEIHAQTPGARRSRWAKNSARVRSRVRNSPSTDEVVMI